MNLISNAHFKHKDKYKRVMESWNKKKVLIQIQGKGCKSEKRHNDW